MAIGSVLHNFLTNFFPFIELIVTYQLFCVCLFRFTIKTEIGQNLVKPRLTKNKTLGAETIQSFYSQNSSACAN